MATIERLRTDRYPVPLDSERTDSPHGARNRYEFVTARTFANLGLTWFEAPIPTDDLEAHGFGRGTYIEQPVQIKDGQALAPDRSGHGVLFDWDRLEAIR